jgi:tRNA nucleotidyltransferase/poly(A) polymerase
MRKSFFEYFVLKEADQKPSGGQDTANVGIPSEVKLTPDGPYKPFTIGDEHHPNLRVVVQAFLDSDKVPYPGPDGYPGRLTTMEKGKGETTPRLKKKVLYLVGGAVRDHLMGKTPKDYDLATDATPDEIRLILRHAGFTEVRPQTGKHAPVDKKYNRYPDPGNKNRIYYAKGWDRSGREFVMGARVNGEEFEIATFRKDSKSSDGRTPDRMEFAGLEDDSARRDFTINAMYIPLTSADGDNSKVVDPHGGAHHLRSGDVRFVGNAKDRLQEDQLRALRYIRFLARSGKSVDTIPSDYKEAIAEIKDLPSVSRERIREEFVKGLEHPDVDPRLYISLYKQTGLLQTVFPNMTFKLDDMNKDYTDKRDRRLVVAWILRHNNPDDIRQMLAHGTWTNNEINDILHLIKVYGWGLDYKRNPQKFYDSFYDMKNSGTRTSIVPSIMRTWGKMVGLDDEMMNNFIGHELGTRGMVDQGGKRVVNPVLTQRLGRTPVGEDFGKAIRDIETEKFRGRFNKNRGDEQQPQQ